MIDNKLKPQTLMEAALSEDPGDLCSFIVIGTLDILKDKDTFTIKDLREAQNKLFGVNHER